MATSKKRPGAIVEEVVVRRKDDLRSASLPPKMVRELGLDDRLMSFLLSERPPLKLGSAPPDVILESIPPEAKAKFREQIPPDGDDARVDRVSAEGIGLPATATEAPPPPPMRSPKVRAKQLVKQLESAGPGDEAPVIQALLRIGAPALPLVADAFPGLLWFHRHLPHVAVPLGRDVSPLARTLVAFGDVATETVRSLLGETNADRRFYALLVAQDLGADVFASELSTLVLDPDAQVRAVAAATLLGLPTEARAPARERLEAVLTDPRAPRTERLEAVHALACLREEASLHALVQVARDPMHPDLQELASGALTALTGREFGVNPDAWQQFAKKDGNRPRIEWLIDALRTTAPELVKVVLTELAKLTGESFGDPDPDDTRARKKVASAYATWWKQNRAKSRSLFGRLIRI